MRIRRLNLNRFGHFTEREFNFGPAREGRDFHIIYGPNEAGKTTTMEAALRLFYGFAPRENYAFKHPRSNLQVSAELEIDGAPRHFTRLPKRSGSLLDETGTPLPETALSAHLAGLAEEDYRRLLCLDDETLERGGEEIANAEGDIGRLLFSAAAGVADLSGVLDGVRERADALWKKRGRTTRIAELKRTLSEVEKQIKDHDVTASAWKTLKRDLQKAQEAEQRARKTRDDLNIAKAHMEAQRRALPLLSEISELEATIAPFSAYPDQLDFDAERLIELRSDRGIATQNIDRLSQEIAARQADLTEVSVDPELLKLAAALDALEDLSARDRTAGLDLGRREEEQKAAETAMKLAARDLGIAVQTPDLQRLVLSSADIAALERARETLRGAMSRADAEASEVSELNARVTSASEALEDCAPATEDAPRVADILMRFDADGLAPAHAAALQAIEAATIRASRALSALSIAGVHFEHLPACPSSRAEATLWAERHQDLLRDLRTTQDKRDAHLEELEARKAQAAALTRDTKIVPDDEAQKLRARRDEMWSAHLARLDTRSATDFHDAMHQHDTASDLRLTQSRDLAQLREIGQAEAVARARAAQTDKHLAALSGERTDIEAAVREAGDRVGLSGDITPALWLDWVIRHETAEDEARALRDTTASYRQTLQRAAALLTELAEVLPFPPTELGHALSVSRRMAEDDRKRADARTKAVEAVRQARKELSRRETRYKEALKVRTDADTAWQALVRDLLGDALSPERLMISLEPLRDLCDHEKARAAAERRVKTMRADQEQFAQEVDALARTHDLEPRTTAAETYAALMALAEQARRDREAGRKLETELETAKTERSRNEDRRDAIDQEVVAIAAFFPDPNTLHDIDALRQVATRAQQVIDNRAMRDKLTRQVLSDLGTADLEEARAQLSETSIAALESCLDSNESDLTHAEAELTRAIQTRVTAEHALAEIKGDGAVASLVEQKATLELQLEDAAVEHLELSLGHHLASNAIRRYRDSHRSGMLAATEQCFASLTQGAYPSLSTQTDKEAEVLLAVDRNGVSKRAAEMSKGTRFQLYLALRAAAHEQLVAQGTKLPFFCDDIFETFDEARTSAACRVMETIGTHGQAIYLTHHRHVVEIAMTVCETPPMVHEL
ncbi:AAA family ATPase [uncultured Celeribacter sp.]|uniref:ATP-binding protein n=1 Tax=uncultured Celeribacter sp. TaxID=1303376 RepID=UPI002AA686B3|nr:AAA family ATPase [uncultured Celeribacter sp.]